MMSTLAAALNWRPTTPFYYGWLIIAMAALGTFAATGVTQAVLGGIQGFIIEDLDWSRGTIAVAATAGTWSAGLLAPAAGRLADRYGPRWLMSVGLVVVGLSLFSLAGIQYVWQFYAAYILGRAVSNPVLVGVVPHTAAVNFFRRRRNTALALIGMARPVGSAVNIQIIFVVAARYGWRTAYRYLGFLSFFLVLPLAITMRRRPEDIGLLPDGAGPEEVIDEPSRGGPAASNPGREDPQGVTASGESEFSWTVREALHTSAFWLVTITATVSVLGSSAVGFIMVPYLHEESGISTSRAAGVLSISTFLAVASLGWSYLADRFTPKLCLMVAHVGTGAMILYLFTVSSPQGAYIFGVLWGLFNGSIAVLEHMVLAHYFGRRHFGSIIGTISPLRTAGLGLGPSAGALSHGVTGSFKPMNAIMAVGFFLAALLIFLARPPVLRRHAFTAPPVEDQ